MRTGVVAIAACVASAALLAPGAPSVAVSPNLILSYQFNTDTTTAIKDSSASALTGTLVNGDPAAAFVKGAPGKKKKGLKLNASQHQYVGVPESNALDIDRYTLAAWVRYTGVQTPDTLGRWEVMEKAGAYWLNVRTNGKVRAGGFYGGCENSQYWKFLDSSRTLPVNVWSHVAATYNGSQLVIYINGVASGSMTVSGTTCSNDEPLAVGAKNAPAKRILEAFWDGRLDDVRIYNKALSAARIEALAE